MIVLGVSNTKDSGACLLVDGKLIASVNEERLNREKLTRVFPERSIDWLLESQGLKTNDVDAIGLGTWKGVNSPEDFSNYKSKIEIRIKQDPAARETINARIQGSIASDTKQWIEFQAGLQCMGFGRHRVIQCHHQMAHAYTAFEYSPHESALVVVFDGRGDFMSGLVGCFKKGIPPRILRTELEIDSLGAFYGWITHYLGFTPDRHEGKVTGLAAFGNPDKCIGILKKMIGVEHGSIRANPGKYYVPYMKADLPQLSKELDRYKPEDVAAAAQKLLEDIVVFYIRYYLQQTGKHNLCVAGGIFANVLVNMKLRELPEVDRFFVFPHMGDGGIAAGGAACAAIKLGDRIRTIQDVYLGPCFNDVNYKNIVNNTADLEVVESGNFSEQIALLLHRGAVVGFFCGRMEYGPRALGGRSILTRTTDSNINSQLNSRLNRTEFMPFAPVTLEEEAGKCYVGWSKKDIASYYMTSCYRCTDLMKKLSPGVVHVDGTARPQIINREIHLIYHDILKAYYDLTGIPSLINTSFNYHEEPIICIPDQAVESLKNNIIDVLVMPPFILFKDRKWRNVLESREEVLLRKGTGL